MVLANEGFFDRFLTITEFAIGLGLLLGVLSPVASLDVVPLVPLAIVGPRQRHDHTQGPVSRRRARSVSRPLAA